MAKTIRVKTKNPQDLTLRNLRALNKLVAALAKRVTALERRG